MNKRLVLPRSWGALRWTLVAVFSVGLVLSSIGPFDSAAYGHRFGFRGGFRGGFGGAKFRGRSGFRGSRFGSFRRFNFRGVRGFGRSRFNSLAFRGRRFGGFRGSRFSRFGGFNRGVRFNRFRNFGFTRFPQRFSSFRPGFNSFAFSHFPSNRFHSGFGNFHRVGVPSHRLSRFTPVSKPVVFHNVGGVGWTQLTNYQPISAQQAFINDISSGSNLGTARVGFSLASADAGDLSKGVWAMRRAFEMNKDEISKMMLDDSLRPAVARVTRLYEDKMEKDGADNDTSFMLAALYQLQGDPEMASMAMDAMVYPEMVSERDVAANNLGDLVKSEMSLIPMAKGPGWDLLSQGEAAKAMEQFVSEIQKDTSNGVAKLGYALAAAEQGDLKLSSWAIDRAFTMDSENVSNVVLSGELRPVVQSVIARFEGDAESNGVGKENSMALAALYQLQGDVESAEVMVMNAPMDDDNFVVNMIKEEMDAQKSMMDDMMEDEATTTQAEISGPVDVLLPNIVSDSSSAESTIDLVAPSAYAESSDIEQSNQRIASLDASSSGTVERTNAKIAVPAQSVSGSSTKQQPSVINGNQPPLPPSSPPASSSGSGTR